MNSILIKDINSIVILNQDGISIVCLGNCDKRVVIDDNKKEYVIHSLESFNYLKIDPGNFITIEKKETEIVINVMQEYVKTSDDDSFTTFSKVYSIKVG